MTRETELCQGEFLWKYCLNSISMKRQLTDVDCTCMKESVMHHTLNLTRSINFSCIFSLGNKEAILKHTHTQKRFLLYCNVIILAPIVEKISQGGKKSIWKE